MNETIEQPNISRMEAKSIEALEKELAYYKQKVSMYEQNGSAKLYYSLQRKMNEMADMLNSNSMSSINLDDPKDKSFDRIFRLLEKSETVGNAAKALGDFAGVTGDEDRDVSKKPFVETIAESRR
jgi:hypothetical protein